MNIPATKDSSGLAGLKFISRVKQPLSTEVLLYTLHFREKTQTGLPSLLHVVPTLFMWAGPCKKAPSFKFWPIGLKMFPSNWTCTAKSSLASLSTSQSSSILTNQDNAIWTNQTIRIWSLNLHGNGQRPWLGTLIYIRQLHLCFNWVRFHFPSQTECAQNWAATLVQKL